MTSIEECELLLNNINKRVDDIYNFLKDKNEIQDKRLNTHADQLKEIERWKNKVVGGMITIAFMLSVLAGCVVLIK